MIWSLQLNSLYLLQSVDGEPKEIIKGLSNTDQNYNVAVDLLTER